MACRASKIVRQPTQLARPGLVQQRKIIFALSSTH